MSHHLKSKSFGTCNFIGNFALKLCTNSHNLIMKMTQHVTSQSKKDNEKQNYKMKAILYVKLNIYKSIRNPSEPIVNQSHDYITKTLNSKFLM